MSVTCTKLTTTQEALEFRPNPVNFVRGSHVSDGVEPGQNDRSEWSVPRVVTPTFLHELPKFRHP